MIRRVIKFSYKDICIGVSGGEESKDDEIPMEGHETYSGDSSLDDGGRNMKRWSGIRCVR